MRSLYSTVEYYSSTSLPGNSIPLITCEMVEIHEEDSAFKFNRAIPSMEDNSVFYTKTDYAHICMPNLLNAVRQNWFSKVLRCSDALADKVYHFQCKYY